LNTTNTQSNAVPESQRNSQVTASQVSGPAVIPSTQLMYWSVRRELMENRSIYIAPLAVAAVFLLGFMVSLVHFPQKMRGAFALDAMKRQELIEQPYHFASLLIMGAYLFVAVFYCLDALYGERRDRSILFWKSLPLSDLMTVLSKASIPILVLPIVTFAITLATQWMMLFMSSVVLLGGGVSPAVLWSQLPWLQMSVMLFYHLLAIHGLYYAPLYCWMLLVSSWARRAPILWASLPLLVISIVEKVTFNTWHFANLLNSLVSDAAGAQDISAPGSVMMHPLTLQTVGRYLGSPGLWIGLTISAAFLAAAVRIRRYQSPI
jgi:ABC-2 type transport system permease protein